MERLTKRQPNNFVTFEERPRGFLCSYRFCIHTDTCHKTADRTCPYLKTIDRLAAYEDTGLEPEEIGVLCSMDRRAKMANLLRLLWV